MNIVAYPRDFDGPGCYRIMYPLAQLRHGGHHATLGPHQVIEESEKFKAVHYGLSPDLVPGAELVVMAMPMYREFCIYQKQLQAKGVKVIIELDDDYLNLPDWNPAKKMTAPTVEGGGILNLMWCLRYADAVTVSTPALRDSVRGVTDAPIYVLRNFLDWRVFERRNVVEDRPWSKFRVGYLGMAQWHSGDLAQLNPWFGEWLEAHPDVEFVAAGDHSIHDLLGVPGAQRVTVDGYAFRHQEIADYAATMDVGLVPLVPNLFNEAKSHLKGMEYAGVGVPCIATPTESYRDWWLSGPDSGPDGAGFLALRPEEWVRALDELAASPELRTRMGRRARTLASENTIQAHWRLWENAYQEVLGDGKRDYADKAGQRVDSLGVRLVGSGANG